MFIFEPKDVFFQTLHPLTILIYCIVMISGIILADNPVVLVIFFIFSMLYLYSARALSDFAGSLKFMLFMSALIIVVNVIVNHSGATILWLGPAVPVFGHIKITLEAIAFAFVMGFRIILIFVQFLFYNQVMNPDNALGMLSRVMPHSALLISMTTKTIPYMTQLVHRVSEVMQCRGAAIYKGKRLARLKNAMPLVKVLFLSSLEDSMNIGESIQSRGYGMGKRTKYFYMKFRIRDLLVSLSSIGALICLIEMRINGIAQYAFYPELQSLEMDSMGLVLSAVLAALLLMPILISWGWKNWDGFRSRI